MFVISCPSCGGRELVSTGRILGIHNSEHGPAVLTRCRAGHLVLTDVRTDQSINVDEPQTAGVAS